VLKRAEYAPHIRSLLLLLLLLFIVSFITANGSIKHIHISILFFHYMLSREKNDDAKTTHSVQGKYKITGLWRPVSCFYFLGLYFMSVHFHKEMHL